MRKLLVLAAIAALAACHRQSDTDVGQASPDTGKTTSDTAMTTTPRSGQTGQEMPADSATMRNVPDTAGRSTTGTSTSPSQTDASGQAGATGQAGASGQTEMGTDSLGNRGDSAMVNHSVPDTSSSKSGWSKPSSGQSTTTDSSYQPTRRDSL